MENDELARQLAEIADLLDVQGGNEFRVRSYQNAARTVAEYPSRLADLVAEGRDLTELPNIGQSIAEDVEALLAHGHCERLDELRASAPGGLPEIMRIRGLGARKAKKLYDALGIDSLDELREACEQGRVREVPDFGPRTEQNILRGIAEQATDSNRLPLKAATEHAESLGRHLDGIEGIERWELAGSLRRRKETIGDLDVVICARERAEVAEAIAGYAAIDRVLSRGKEKSTVQLTSGLRVDFRFFESRNFGAALMYFTGSKEHNVAVRGRARQRGWKMNEYGIMKGDRLLAAKDEEALYHRLDMAWIPPELREDRGEIEAAENGALPDLVELDEIRGDLHCHTKETDGEDTLHDMVEAGRALGYEYMAITDHSEAVSLARGMDAKRLKRHAGRIRKTNAAIEDFRVLAGIEVDILKSGELDLDLDALDDLDWVVASVHSDFDLLERKMTDRLVRAIESGVIHCLGHPLCRQIGRRDPIAFDADTVLAACAENGVLLEVNANPTRLDLPDVYCKLAKEHGAVMVISTDSHRTTDLEFMRYGVDVARRGWLEAGDVANTRRRDAFLALLGD